MSSFARYLPAVLPVSLARKKSARPCLLAVLRSVSRGRFLVSLSFSRSPVFTRSHNGAPHLRPASLPLPISRFETDALEGVKRETATRRESRCDRLPVTSSVVVGRIALHLGCLRRCNRSVFGGASFTLAAKRDQSINTLPSRLFVTCVCVCVSVCIKPSERVTTKRNRHDCQRAHASRPPIVYTAAGARVYCTFIYVRIPYVHKLASLGPLACFTCARNGGPEKKFRPRDEKPGRVINDGHERYAGRTTRLCRDSRYRSTLSERAAPLPRSPVLARGERSFLRWPTRDAATGGRQSGRVTRRPGRCGRP